MNTYENAPATKLLATACACCGRALVDAVSVETGIGPDCRAKYGVDMVVDSAAHAEANELVFQVARKGVTRETARAIFDRLAALGFVVLAERIAKRFHATLTPALTEEQVQAFRAEYAKIRAAYCYDNCTPDEFNVIVRLMNPDGPEDFVACARKVACGCKRCKTSGHFFRDGAPAGECFRCEGKGHQTIEDSRRNRAYDATARMLRAS